jgi:hypothetical protein
LVDTEGRVDRFQKQIARSKVIQQKKADIATTRAAKKA